jgi:putative membrane protein
MRGHSGNLHQPANSGSNALTGATGTLDEEKSEGRMRMRFDRYKFILVIAFIVAWIWAAIDPLYPDDWLLENYLVFIFVPIVLVSARYFRLSNLSYTFIALFMILHVAGSHYTYSETPFGYVLQQWMGGERNMYDRFVHFAFGLMIAYPFREVFMRLAHAQGLWSYVFPFAVVLAASTVYEIIEWLVAARVDPAAGLAFLGTQGNVWDAQKEMIAAAGGALIALSLVAAINWYYDPAFAGEIRRSLRIPPGDRPIGEVRLRELIANQLRRKK